MNVRLRVLKIISRYQFGADIIPEEARVELSRTGKPRRVFLAGQRYAAVNPATTSLILYLPAGRTLYELTGRRYVKIRSPEFLISDVFAPHVTDADEGIRPGDEVVVIYKDEVLAVGKARISGRSMIDANRGLAVRVREKIGP